MEQSNPFLKNTFLLRSILGMIFLEKGVKKVASEKEKQGSSWSGSSPHRS